MKSITACCIATLSAVVPAIAQAHPGHELLETDAGSKAVLGIVPMLASGDPLLWAVLALSVAAAIALGMKAPSQTA